MRRGGATLLFQLGCSPLVIQAVGDWRSDQFLKYCGLSLEQRLSAQRLMCSQANVVGDLGVWYRIITYYPHVIFLYFRLCFTLSLSLSFYWIVQFSRVATEFLPNFFPFSENDVCNEHFSDPFLQMSMLGQNLGPGPPLSFYNTFLSSLVCDMNIFLTKKFYTKCQWWVEKWDQCCHWPLVSKFYYGLPI